MIVESLIFIGNTFHTFEVKYLNEPKPKFIVLKVLLKNLLVTNSLIESISLIIVLGILNFTFNGFMAKSCMFLCWIQTDLSFWSKSLNDILSLKKICRDLSFMWFIFQLNSVSWNTQICIDINSDWTGLQQTTSLNFFSIGNPLDLIILRIQIISR